MIPLKIIGLSQAAHGSRSKCFALGVVMSAGVVAFWMALGTAIATIKGFDTTSQLFQKPEFTIAVGVIIAIMAVGMAGFFTVNLPDWVHLVDAKHDSYAGSFLFGIMTAVLSTPCTAPLMGTAVFWATTQGPATILTVFAAVGTGMALPYLVLSANPKWIDSMPRTGPASDLISSYTPWDVPPSESRPRIITIITPTAPLSSATGNSPPRTQPARHVLLLRPLHRSRRGRARVHANAFHRPCAGTNGRKTTT